MLYVDASSAQDLPILAIHKTTLTVSRGCSNATEFHVIWRGDTKCTVNHNKASAPLLTSSPPSRLKPYSNALDLEKSRHARTKNPHQKDWKEGSSY